MELAQSRGMQRRSYPQFDVAVKGQKVVVKFDMPSTCNVLHLIVDLVTRIGLEAEQHGGGLEVLVRAWDSPAARQITLNPPKKNSTGDLDEDGLCVLIFEPLIGTDYSEIEFIKRGSFSLKELEALISALKIDGFEQDRRVVVIAATNRKEDLDPALISHFDSIICFGLPDQQTRMEIAAQYAKHLTKSELVQFSLATEEMSGRDIRDVCQQAESHWASKVSNHEAIDVVSRSRNAAVTLSVARSCVELVDMARRTGSRDDVTVTVVDLERFVR
ncbi:protein MSP1 isoform X2 [Panicum miliaceum]|uniref:protein-serine/threonine phosphatase n=1 Tax=Panicum miliaceum TaxID=4540 RepID=A0A3L6QM73_PANMI|nr:protein MSP1 isoform X2 [Panicum miliaceum]